MRDFGPEVQFFINHEKVRNPYRIYFQEMRGYTDHVRFTHDYPQEYTLTLESLGGYWENWIIMKVTLHDAVGMMIGEATAPVYMLPTDHPTALFHFYATRIVNPEPMKDIEPMLFTMSIKVPRS